jgi:hypothetical protein
MERKEFLKYSALSAGAILAAGFGSDMSFASPINKIIRPRAITMWDFSWLERRWIGGGYEDWDKVLDDLVIRGYNAVRIDAYPHLVAANPQKEWTLVPVWDRHDWGSPGIIKVEITKSLIEFMAKCKNRNIKIGLSTWYREDLDNTRLLMTTPQKMAENWLKVLDIISNAKLLDSILYVDMCNEWCAEVWTPYFKAKRNGHDWSIPESLNWMKETLGVVGRKYPELPLTFSFDHYQEGILKANPTPYLDVIEQHIWMASLKGGEFNNIVGIDWDGFSPEDIKRVVIKAEPLYRSKPEYWNNILTSCIKQFAQDAKSVNMPLISTECWSLVFFKDYPMLNWNWIKDLCELGVVTSASTGQWVAIATSNFCGPQFKGMWNDVEWHQRLTAIIKNAPISEELKNKKILNRL